MKYRLKKDLPFAKAGAEVIVNLALGVCVEYDGFIADSDGLNLKNTRKYYIGDLYELLNEGWIEEVKPREFEITFADGGYITRVRELNADNEIINPQFYSDNRKNTTIKVREVLE